MDFRRRFSGWDSASTHHRFSPGHRRPGSSRSKLPSGTVATGNEAKDSNRPFSTQAPLLPRITFRFVVRLAVVALVGLTLRSRIAAYLNRPKPWSWTGDARVNVPVYGIDLDMVVTSSSPVPIVDDALAILSAVTNISQTITFPHGPNGAALTLDAPGVEQIGIRPWSTKWGDAKGAKRDMAQLVATANITVTLLMLEDLWPELSKAAITLLDMSIGPNHGDYKRLKRPLAPPPKPVKLCVQAAISLWTGLRSWSFKKMHDDVRKWVSGRAQRHEEFGTAPNAAPVPNTVALGLRAPSPIQLLEHYHRYHRQSDAALTLPDLLASLDASSHVKDFVLAWQQGFYTIHNPVGELSGHCRVGERLMDFNSRAKLKTVASGVCAGENERYYGSVIYMNSVNQVFDDELPKASFITQLNDALYDAESFLSDLAQHAMHARMAAASFLLALYSYSEDPGAGMAPRIKDQLDMVDALLHQVHLLLPSLRLQRPILASAASQILNLCKVFDDFPDNVTSLRQAPGWWTLQWNEDSGKIEAMFKVVPEPADVAARLRKAVKITEDRFHAIPEAVKSDIIAAALPGSDFPYGKRTRQWMINLGLKKV